MGKITHVVGREILDSRGDPTVEEEISHGPARPWDVSPSAFS
jgi:enolase